MTYIDVFKENINEVNDVVVMKCDIILVFCKKYNFVIIICTLHTFLFLKMTAESMTSWPSG